MTPLRARRVALLLTLLLVLVPLWNGLEQPGPPQEEGALLAQPERIGQGAKPYRDFEVRGGPANLYVLAGAYALCGPSVETERGVGLLYRVAILTALFCLLQRHGLVPAIGGMVLAATLLTATGTVAFAGLGALACALWCLWLPATAWSGLLAGLTFLFEPLTGLALLAAGVFRPGRRHAFFLGATAGLMPLVWVRGHGLFTPELPLGGSTAPLLSLLLAAAALNLIATAVFFESACRLPCPVFVAGIAAAAFLHPDLVTVTAFALVTLPFAPVSLALLFCRRAPSLALASATLAAVLFALVLVAPSLPRRALLDTWHQLSAEPSAAINLEGHGRRFPMASLQTVIAAGPIVEDLEHLGRAGQRLFVSPGDPYLYHLLPQFTPASRCLESDSARSPTSLAAEAATADWIILNRAQLEATTPGAPFERCARHGPWELYRRAASPHGA